MILIAIQEIPNYFTDSNSIEIKDEIYNSLCELMKINSQMKNKNFPASFSHHMKTDLPEEKDKIQFCHGAPGFIHLYLIAWKFYEKDEFLNFAVEHGELIWKKGILKKGFSLCHGICGNAYCLYALYKFSNQKVWLERFLDFLFLVFNNSLDKIISEYDDRSRYIIGTADTPYSLMEGIGGIICLISDFLSTLQSQNNDNNLDYVFFPGYEI